MAENYQYQDIIIRFDVYKDGEETRPEIASVVVYDPDRKYTGRHYANIVGSEVRYILQGTEVQKVGRYIFVFQVKVEGLGDYTHVVKVNVESLPIPIEEAKLGSLQ